MLSYNADYMKNLKVIAQGLLLTKFNNSIRNRNRRVLQKLNNVYKKHRAGWRVALRSRTLKNLPIPEFISSNVRSLIGKFDDFSTLIQSKQYRNVGVILLQESWLHGEIENNVVHIDGFTLHRSDRPSTERCRGGGVVSYINNIWCKSVKVVMKYSTKSVNCVTIECKPRFLSKYRSIIISNIYIAPGTSAIDLKKFVDVISINLTGFIDTSLCIVAGDFNRIDTKFLNLLGLHDVVHFPTRLNAQLDSIFTNDKHVFTVCNRAPLSSSDHCIIALQPKIYCKDNYRVFIKKDCRTIKHRNCSEENIEKLRDMLSTTDFSIFNNNDASKYCESLTDYLKFCYEMCCPLETIFIHPQRFNSPYLKQLRRKKEHAYKHSLRTEVKYLSKLIKHEISRLNKLYTQTLLGDQSCREMWKVLKRLCGSQSKTNYPDVRIDDLNREFVTDASIPDLNNLGLPSASDLTISLFDVRKQLQSLKTSKASGADNLSPVVLKACADILSEPITDLFRACISAEIIPENWKTVQITPVPKKDSSKFRPIACTPVLLKCFEKMLLSHMTSQNFEDDKFQFAYKKSRSTLDAVANVVHTISSALDKKCKGFRLIFLDYSNAFGNLDRAVLCRELSTKLSSKVMNLVQNYFSDRKQFTRFNGKRSCILPVNSGVLQGAILSPFFFSFYVSNLPIPNDVFHCKYADDVVFGSACSQLDNTSKLQVRLDELAIWSASRSLLLNPTKSQDLIFSLYKGEKHKTSFAHCTPLSLNDNVIPQPRSVKYLGLTLSHNLTWTLHIESVFTRVRKLSFYCLRLRHLSVPRDIIFRFVSACILPLWLYCSPVVFAGLLEKDYCLIKRSIKHIAKNSGIDVNLLVNVIVKRHFDSCRLFAQNIISEESHPLHAELMSSKSVFYTRSDFKLMYTRTTSFGNSVLPYLLRFLVKSDNVLLDLTNKLSSS